MKWWQQILVDIFTNKYFNIVFAIVVFVLVTHYLGYNPERWLSQAFNWLMKLNPSDIFG